MDQPVKFNYKTPLSSHARAAKRWLNRHAWHIAAARCDGPETRLVKDEKSAKRILKHAAHCRRICAKEGARV